MMYREIHKAEPCECPRSGWCERHKIAKTAHWHMLCKTQPSYRQAWDEGWGPGQHMAVGTLCCRPARGKDERIRVGLLTPTLMFGGAERWVAALATGLDKARFDVVVGVRERDATLASIQHSLHAANVTVVDGQWAFEWVADRCDILIVWGLTALNMIAGYRRIVVMVSHGCCDWTLQCYQKCRAEVTHLTAVSRHAAEVFMHHSVEVVHNGIDTPRCVVTVPREAVRSEWGLRSGELAIGFVGRFSADKNPLGVVHAVQQLGAPYRAVMIGGGPYAAPFIAQSRKIMPSTIIREPVDQVGNIYNALDCMILTSPSEGFSLGLAEAWYCRCPTVATPVGATEVQELHGALTVYVPIQHSAKQVADAIVVAMSDANRPVIERAARVVARHYTADHMCRRWERYIDGLLA